MRHITALFVKFVMVAIVLETVLNIFTNLTFGDILYISGTVTILAYIIGDILILSMSNNTLATIADIGLALFTIYMFNYIWSIDMISYSDATIAALGLGVGEWFFHKYGEDNVLRKPHEG